MSLSRSIVSGVAVVLLSCGLVGPAHGQPSRAGEAAEPRPSLEIGVPTHLTDSSFPRSFLGSAAGWTVGAGTLGYIGYRLADPTESWFGPSEMWLGGLVGGAVGSAIGGHLLHHRLGNPLLAGLASVGGAALAVGISAGAGFPLVTIPLGQIGGAAVTERLTGR